MTTTTSSAPSVTLNFDRYGSVQSPSAMKGKIRVEEGDVNLFMSVKLLLITRAEIQLCPTLQPESFSQSPLLFLLAPLFPLPFIDGCCYKLEPLFNEIWVIWSYPPLPSSRFESYCTSFVSQHRNLGHSDAHAALVVESDMILEYRAFFPHGGRVKLLFSTSEY